MDHALVGGGDLPCEAETVVRGGDLSCEAETCHVRWRLLGGGPSSGELVGEAPKWSGIGRLASDGLDKGPWSSSS
jgi:hypothetical protein